MRQVVRQVMKQIVSIQVMRQVVRHVVSIQVMKQVEIGCEYSG